MADFADIGDVAAIWHSPLSDAETFVVAARLGEASQLVRDTVPSVDARILDGSLSALTVKYIVANMVQRLVSHPAFVRQQSVSIDDGNKSVTFDASVSKGSLFLTEDELARLLGVSDAAGGQAFEIVLGLS